MKNRPLIQNKKNNVAEMSWTILNVSNGNAVNNKRNNAASLHFLSSKKK